MLKFIKTFGFVFFLGSLMMLISLAFRLRDFYSTLKSHPSPEQMSEFFGAIESHEPMLIIWPDLVDYMEYANFMLHGCGMIADIIMLALFMIAFSILGLISINYRRNGHITNKTKRGFAALYVVHVAALIVVMVAQMAKTFEPNMGFLMAPKLTVPISNPLIFFIKQLCDMPFTYGRYFISILVISSPFFYQLYQTILDEDLTV